MGKAYVKLDGNLVPAGMGIIAHRLPSLGSGLFTGATIPLTYKDYVNEFEYNSAYKITITGLNNVATITGNGTNNVKVVFNTSGNADSLLQFNINIETKNDSYDFKGLWAHYGSTIGTDTLVFYYNNISPDSVGTIGVEYGFITSSTLPMFSNNKTLWKNIYSHQLLNVIIGSNITNIGSNFLFNCYAFNQPITIPSELSSIGNDFMRACYAFNQVLTLPSSLSSIGDNFMYYCSAFNQPLTLPSELSSIGNYFMYNCYAFNQVLTLPSELSSIGNYFMYNCFAFNQVLTLPSELSSIGNDFMRACSAFNQVLTLPSSLSSIGYRFMYNCFAFNQPLTLPSSLSSIGDRFMYNCYAFNQPLTLPSSLSSIGDRFMYNCFALSTIIWNASVYPTDNNSLSQDINTKTNSTSGAGIKVYGTNRSGLISALPDRTTSPFRKLIDGGR